MSLFKKKATAPVVLPAQPRAAGSKKVSIFDVHRQAYYEISLEEYYSTLRALGLSDGEAKAKVQQVSK